MQGLSKKFLKVCKELEGVEEIDDLKLWAVPRRTAELLRMLVLARRPKVILELGTSLGYSTIWLAAGAAEINAEVYTMEFMQAKINYAQKNFKQAGVSDQIVQLHGRIGEMLPAWKKKIDFVFMDADKKGYFDYLKQLEPYLTKGALIVADNALDHQHLMKNYLKYVSTSPKYISSFLEIDHGLMLSIKK